MRQFSFLIKPASGCCNYRCRYCFYEDTAPLRENGSERMTEETAENIVRKTYAVAEPGDAVFFCFQGGEPSLAGLPFFQRFVALVKEYNVKNVHTDYAFQTNGALIDPSWVRFFRRNSFLVGVSLDGMKDIHDRWRTDGGGKGTYERAKEAFSLLDDNGVEANILTVVTRDTARNAEAVYRALKGIGASYLQFIPCLDPYGEERGGMEWSLTPEDYGTFLCALFDLWYSDWKEGRYTSVRLFEDYVHVLLGDGASTCATSGRCGSYMVVEADGTVYPCDFYVLPERRMGNINEDSVTELLEAEAERKFIGESLVRPKKCQKCRYGFVCRSGCRRDWTEREGRTENYYCSSFIRFFDYTLPRIEEIARAEREARRGLHQTSS